MICMNHLVDFSFGDDSVAKAYDSLLVPSLFTPWAMHLIQAHEPWTHKHVLDVACGTGAVTKELARSVGPAGKVFALDINRQMLDIARSACAEWAHLLEFIEGAAESMAIPDNTLDTVVCQQGFQFFPDKAAAATEIYRVLKPGGNAMISTWCPVAECEIFGALCESLEEIQEDALSQLMRVPFDFMPAQDLQAAFQQAGYLDIQVSKQKKHLHLPGERDSAIAFAYATPIGPKLSALDLEKQRAFQARFTHKMQVIYEAENHFGQMASHVLNAIK